jgi:hypothetical protein
MTAPKRCPECKELIRHHQVLMAPITKVDSPAMAMRKGRVQQAHLIAEQPAGLTFNVKHIRDRIAVIAAVAKTGDYEAAHSEEDRLYRDALLLIRDGKFINNEEIADETLQVGKLKFARLTA